MTNESRLALRLCSEVIDNPQMSNATAKIAAWLIGAASKLGGFPLELSLSQIRNGFERDGVKIAGTGSRAETIKASIQWLEDNGLLTTSEGKVVGFGFQAQVYDMVD